MRWPGRLRAGSTSSQVGITMDLTASILAATGVTPPANYRAEGIDLLGALQRRTRVERTLFWRMPTVPVPSGTSAVTQRAVRRGDWKYIDDRGQYLLFDLRTDAGERNDVAHQHLDIVRDLRALMTKWEADVDTEAKQRTRAVK
jgi:arylsulfatase A-like enzyme